MDADADEAEPDERAEAESPEERGNATVNAGRPEMHQRESYGTKKIRRAGFAFVHRFR